MSNFVKEIYCLNKEQYKMLMKRYGEERLFDHYKYFQVAPKLHKITSWWLNYFIDTHGDFTERKTCKFIIAQAILASMKPAEQIETYKYIEDSVKGRHDKRLKKMGLQP